ncbi:hypothetical protein CF326_g4578 [Tilletia indica]|nr:hypothetical protein CF326_g4578 [Tilletia indica]
MTSGASAALVVNGQRLRALPIRLGLQQGSSCSPIFFAFLADEPLAELNEGVSGRELRAVFFADDGAIAVHNRMAAQDLLNTAEAWATRRGMRFNVQKCGVVSPFPVELSLYGRTLPQVASYKYLGIPRSVNGLDIESWLLAKSVAMENSLRYLQALGSPSTMPHAGLWGFAPGSVSSLSVSAAWCPPPFGLNTLVSASSPISSAPPPTTRLGNF